MELDNKLIENYETQELDYNDFYKDDVKYIKTYSLLVPVHTQVLECPVFFHQQKF